MAARRLEIAFAHFSSCSGCQLMLLNCEMELPGLEKLIKCADFGLIDSHLSDHGQIDLVLVEGSISSPRERQRLIDLRQRCRWLVAVGSCATTGGVNRFDMPERAEACRYVYAHEAEGLSVFPPQPLYKFVEVDGLIPGCPPERSDFLKLFGALSCGGWPVQREVPVCMECRIRENRCLLEEDHAACLGPLTQAGCNARCPSIGVPCEGCRGEVAEANRDELYRLLIEIGLPAVEITRRMRRFAGGGSD
jgi:coenzyme F420-reducing hydrogenase gamma subunit